MILTNRFTRILQSIGNTRSFAFFISCLLCCSGAFAAAPTITSITPNTGSVLGGTNITIAGTNFDPASTVTIGGSDALNVVVVNSSQITCTTPAQATVSAAADVVVTGPNGIVGSVGGFTYAVTVPGLNYLYYHYNPGNPPIPDFSTLTPFKIGVIANATITPTNNPPSTNPIEPGFDTSFSVQWFGYVTVPATGDWTFTTNSDDGSRLYIDGALVVENNFNQGQTPRSGTVNGLTKGKHRILVQFSQGGGGYGLIVSWSGPTTAQVPIPDSAFSADPAPAITSITPSSGPFDNQNDITIMGTNFQPNATLKFGSSPATQFQVVNSTTITARMPRLTTLGSVDVTVSDSYVSGALVLSTTSIGGFTYTSAAPVVNSISPTGGVVAGGDTMTINGAHFASGATVTIGGTPATNVNVVRSTLITATIPPGVAGPAVDVVVTNTDTQFGTLAASYTYGNRLPDNPAVTQPGLQYKYYLNASNNGVVPDLSLLVPTSSGIITTNPVFDLSQREFNDNYAMAYTGYLDIPADDTYTFSTDSDDGARLLIGNTLVVNANFNQGQGTPETGTIDLAAGRHAFRVEYAQGNGGFGLAVRFQGSLMGAPIDLNTSVNLFTCDPSPTVTSINPTSGPSNSPVTITGTGFAAGAIVGFNGVAAGQVVVVNATTITCDTSTNPAGISSVVVMNVNGSSGTLLNTTLFDGFTYTGAAFRPPEFATSTGLQNAMFYKYYTNGNQTLPSNTPDAIENLTPFSTGLFLKDQFAPNPITFGPTQFANVGNGNMLTPRTSNNNIFFRYNFYVNAPVQGTYTFGTSSDDGSLLFVGSSLIVNSNFGQGVTDRSGTIDLDVGLHRVTVLFGEGGGGFGLSVRYQKPGDPGLAFIPDSEIFVDPTPTVTAASPAVPSSTGGAITITGTNFLPGATVQVGNTHIINVTVVNSTTITCVVPPGDPGTAPLTVINPIGVSGTGNVLQYYTPATHFEVLAPANAVAGTSFSFTVNALDGNNNIDRSYVGTVDLSSADLNASFAPTSYTFTAGDAGTHVFSNGVTLGTAGVEDVTATDDVTASITGFANVSVTAGPVSNFSVSGFTQPATAGVANIITVSALDDFGNVNPTYVGTIVVTSTDSQAVLPGPFTFSPSDNGTHTLSLTLESSGTQTITVADQASPSFTGSQTVSIDPDVAATLSVSGFPDPSATGAVGNYTVTALDRFGNVATGYAGTVVITTGDPLATFTGDTFDGITGVLSLSGTFNTTGTWDLTATDSLTPSITGTQFSINIETAQTQTIAFGSLGDQVFGSAPFTVSATATSGLPVTFSVTGPAVISGNTITLKGVGTVTVVASQDGDATYSPAPDVAQSFNVTIGSQTINFTNPGTHTFGDAPFALSATATSGLPVSFSLVSGPASVVGNTVTITGTGLVTIQADQAGNANWSPAPAVQQAFAVNPASQTITFGTLSDKVYGDAPFALTATASSGLPVTYSVTAGAAFASVTGNTVTITGVGAVTIQADQAGNANYSAAAPVSQSFNITQDTQTITFPTITDKVYGDAPFLLSATSDSGLPVTYSVTAGSAFVSLTGNTVTIVGVGAVTIQADQAGDANFTAALSVSQSFNITKDTQTITFPSIADKVYGDAPFVLTATSSSGLPVTYSVTAGNAFAFVTGNTVTITGVGSVTIQADQSGDANFSAAAPATQSFTITQEAQTITFPTITDKVYGDAPFTLSATASSGLPVTYSVTSGSAFAFVTGNTVTITGVGSVTIQADQAGDANVSAALAVTQTFSITKDTQTITFPTITDKVYGDAPFLLSATSDSGLPVTYSVTAGSAFVSLTGNTVTITGVGAVTIQASQAGDANFSAATSVSQSFNITKEAQTITFGALANATFGDPPFNLTATASSGLPVSYAVTSGNATVNGTLVTITGTGGVTIQATQTGNANFSAAAPVSQSFTVAKANQTITFGALPNKVFGDTPFTVSATSSSGLAVTFGIVSGPATIVGNTITLTGGGTVVVSADQAGDANFNAATQVTQSFTVSPSAQTITFGALPDKVFVDAPFALTATASSGLPVSFSVVSGPGTIAGSTLTITGAGVIVVAASQAGNATYSAATIVNQNMTVAKFTPIVTWANPADIVVGTALGSTQLNATSTTAGTFAYSPGTGTVLGVGASQSLAVQFTPTDTANNNKVTASVVINVLNAAPTISSVTATPNPATVGDTVILFAAASDINDTLTYSWAFGDGTNGTGASVSHKYTIGTFAAFVTVTDLSGATVTSSVTVKVNPPANTSEDSIPANSPAVLDTDGDGFPDQLEVVNGTNASSATDTPTGSPAGTPLLLPDVKLSIKLNFAKPGSDSIGLAGTLLLPAGSISGQKLSVTIGGVAKNFTLDAKGGAKVGGDSVKVASKGTNTRTGKFAIKLSKGSFAAQLKDYGLTSTADAKSVPVSVPIVLLFEKTLYEKNQAQLYTAKAGKTGATKDKK